MHNDYCTECLGELALSEDNEVYCPECDALSTDPFVDSDGTIVEVNYDEL